MKELILTALILVSVSCSKNGDSGKVGEAPIVQEASISAFVGQSEPILIDLGSIPLGKSADGMISIKQNQVASLIPSGLVGGKLVVSGADELSIISQSGCTSIKKSTGTCNIKVRANTQGLEEGTTISGYIFFHADSETQEETFIQISATVGNAPVVEAPALVSSASTAAFGSLEISDSSKDIILTYKALSLLSSSDSHEVVVPAPFVIQAASADRCSNKTISKGASCTVKIRLDPKLVTSNGLVSGNITFAGLSIPVSATISGNPEVGQPVVSQLAWIYNNQEISSLNLGTLLNTAIPAKFNLFLKNKSSSNEEVNVSFSGNGFSIINRCQNKILAPQGQCSLEVRPESSAGNKSVAISVADQPSLSLPLEVNVVTQVTTYQTVDTTSSCATLNQIACSGTQNISKTYICEQYVAGVKNESYVSNQSDCSPLADMSPLACQSPAGSIEVSITNGTQQVSCLQGSTAQTPVPGSIACDFDHHVQGSDCIADVFTFVPSYSAYSACPINNVSPCNGTGTQIRTLTACQRLRNGQPDASFSIQFCSAFGTLEHTTQTCQSPAGSIQEPIANGSATRYCELGSTSKETTSLNCNSGYQASNDLVSCDLIPLTPNFLPVRGFNVNSSIYAVKTLSNGSTLYGGTFSSFTNPDGTTFPTSYFVKIKPDGTLDQAFQSNLGSGFNNTVRTIEIDSNDNVYVGGNFTSFKGVANSARYIAKLSSNGVLDTTFHSASGIGATGTSSGFDNGVNTIAIDSSNNVYVGGLFTSFKGVANSARFIAKLNTNGVLNTTFHSASGIGATGTSSGFNNNVYALAIDESNNVYVGGFFTGFKGVTNSSRYIAKLSSNGVLDATFHSAAGIGATGTASGFSDAVNSIEIDSSNNVYVGGNFTSFKSVANNARYIAKLSSNGVLDTEFMDNLDIVLGTKAPTSGFNSVIIAISIDSSNNIYVGGSFNSLKNTPQLGQAKLDSNGNIQSYIHSQYAFNQVVSVMKIDSSNNLYVCGGFTHYNGRLVNNIIKFNSNMEVDSDFLENIGSGFDNGVKTIAIDSDDNVYVGGFFTGFKGIADNARYIAKLSSNGVLDTTFHSASGIGATGTSSGFDNGVNTIAIDSSNNVYVGGNFTSFNGGSTNANRIAKLSSNGVLNTTFHSASGIGATGTSSGFNSGVNAIEIDSSNNVYVGGLFTSFKGGINNTNRIAKLSPNGVLDTTFHSASGIGAAGTSSGFDNGVNTIAIDSDDNVYVGGFFTGFKGIADSANRIAKLSSNGVVDSTFHSAAGIGAAGTSSGFNNTVRTIEIDSNDNVYVGGIFTGFKGIADNARYIAKLNSNGVFDYAFSNNLDVIPGTKLPTSGFNNNVYALAIDSDDNVYVGGNFTSFKGISMGRVKTLNQNGEDIED